MGVGEGRKGGAKGLGSEKHGCAEGLCAEELATCMRLGEWVHGMGKRCMPAGSVGHMRQDGEGRWQLDMLSASRPPLTLHRRTPQHTCR